MKQTGNNWWHSHRHRHRYRYRYHTDHTVHTVHLLQEFLYVKVLIVQRIDQILRGEIAIDGQPLKEFEAQIIRVRHHRIGHHRVDCVAYRTGAGNCRCAAAGHHLRSTNGYAIIVAPTRSTLALHLLQHLLLLLLLLVCCCCAAGLLHKLLLLHCQLLLLLRVAHVHAGHLHLCGHHATTSATAATAATSYNTLLLLQQLLHLHIATGTGYHVVLLLLLLSHQLLLHLCRR